MQKLSVLFIEKLDFAGNKSVDKDIQNLVGIVENVLEENTVDIYMNYLVTDVNNVHTSDVIANFARKISVKDDKAHTNNIYSNNEDPTCSNIHQMMRFGLLRHSRFWGVMVAGVSLGSDSFTSCAGDC